MNHPAPARLSLNRLAAQATTHCLTGGAIEPVLDAGSGTAAPFTDGRRPAFANWRSA
jgi:hypothetical protein